MKEILALGKWEIVSEVIKAMKSDTITSSSEFRAYLAMNIYDKNFDLCKQLYDKQSELCIEPGQLAMNYMI